MRTLADIPNGGFVCIYVGNLYTNEEANEQGQNFGDEYFAELDMIETVERHKEGYESDVSFDGDDEDCQGRRRMTGLKMLLKASTGCGISPDAIGKSIITS
jgi:hypothetical protein